MSGTLASLSRTHVRLLAALLVLAAALAGSGERTASAATTRTWLGTAGNNWSTAANWDPAGPPVNGDTLVFPASATNQTATNDIPGLNLVSIQVSGSYTISGLGFTLDSALSVGQGSPALSNPITLGGPLTISVARFSMLALSGLPQSLLLAGQDLVMQGEGQLTVTSGITGVGNVSVPGPGAMVLAAATSYIGTTSVNGGALVLDGGSIGLPGAVSVTDGGAFGGSGTSAPLTFASALLFPGIGGLPGQITTTKLTLSVQTFARFVLNSDAGPGADQVIVNGPVDLGNAALQLRWSADPGIGQTFPIIVGATSLTGTFGDLPEGATFSSRGRRFSITYKGGASGHAVILTRLAAAPADLTVNISGSTPVAAPGATLTLTITAFNRGPGDAPNVVVSANLPPELAFQSLTSPAGYSCATPIAQGSGPITCRGGALAAGATATFVIVTKVAPGASGLITIPAAVSSDADETASADNSTSTSVTISPGALANRRVLPEIAADQ